MTSKFIVHWTLCVPSIWWPRAIFVMNECLVNFFVFKLNSCSSFIKYAPSSIFYFSVNDNFIPLIAQAKTKILSVILDTSLSFSPHIQSVSDAVGSAFRTYPLLIPSLLPTGFRLPSPLFWTSPTFCLQCKHVIYPVTVLLL